MRRAPIILAALITIPPIALAAPPPEIQPIQPRSVTPPSPRPSWMSGDRNALSPPLRNALSDPAPGYRPSMWPKLFRGVEIDLDRSMWRIIDTPTYELNRLELERAANRPNADPQAQRDLLEYERDRQIQQDEIRYRAGRAKSREEQMRRREYELWLNDGLRSAIGEQATADRLALTEARQRRDEGLSRATTADERASIEGAYQTERARILGVDQK